MSGGSPSSGNWTAQQVKEYVDSLFSENRRATDMASEEREKAAQAFALALSRSIEDGDSRLRDHVSGEVIQIRTALESSDKLELERIEAVKERVAEVASHLTQWDAEQVKEYIEALLAENQRATEMAEREREKAALALHQEQQQAAVVAAAERQKSAEALASSLAQSIREGDERLREHITNQIMQINAALTSAETLEIERFQAAKSTTESLGDKIQIIQNAASLAIQKAEVANEKRFESVNEFRGQLSDQANTFVTKSEYEAKHSGLQSKFDDKSEVLDGRLVRVESTVANIQGRMIAYTASGAVVGGIVVSLILRMLQVAFGS